MTIHREQYGGQTLFSIIIKSVFCLAGVVVPRKFSWKSQHQKPFIYNHSDSHQLKLVEIVPSFIWTYNFCRYNGIFHGFFDWLLSIVSAIIDVFPCELFIYLFADTLFFVAANISISHIIVMGIHIHRHKYQFVDVLAGTRCCT